jgi:hypothetical protein
MDRNELKHIGAWLAVPVMAVVNGALRDLAYGKLMSEKLAHSLSVVPLIFAIFVWGWLLARWAPLPSKQAGVRVGLIWLMLTLAFEFGLGALRGLPLREMLAQYDVTQGHLWPLVPLTMGLAPELSRRLVTRRERASAARRAERVGVGTVDAVGADDQRARRHVTAFSK